MEIVVRSGGGSAELNDLVQYFSKSIPNNRVDGDS